MRASYFNAFMATGLVFCRTVLAAGQTGGWVVGWGNNSGGAATGIAPSVTEGPQWNMVGTVAVAGSLLTNVVAISAGDRHSLALTTRGEIFAWGAGGPLNYPFGLTNAMVTFQGRPLRDMVAVAAGRTVGLG